MSAVGAVFANDMPQASNAAHEILVMLRLPPPHYRSGVNYGGGYTDAVGDAGRRRIAEDLARAQGLTVLSGWPMPAIGVDCYVLRVPSAANIDEVVKRVAQDQRAQWVQPMNLYRALGANDTAPSASSKESLYSLQPSARLWKLDEMHKVSTGRGVRIAVIDSAADVTHPDLSGRIDIERNFVDTHEHVAETHGTAVAGIIGARADRGAGVVGIAPQSHLLALRACWQESAASTLCSSFTLAQALQFAIIENAEVINMSLSGPEDPLLARLIDAAIARGATVVGAVDDAAADGGFPASYRGVLAVSDRSGKASVLSVPGDDVPAPAPGGRWNFVSGSSFAAAQIAGAVALVHAVAPASAMRQSAAWVRFPASSPDGAAGYVDACATLQRSAPTLSCAPAGEGTAQVSR